MPKNVCLSEQDFESFLYSAIELFGWNGDPEIGVLTRNGNALRTFADAGVMTGNKGLVVRMDDGSEFQITIVKSR
ncbi:hypothetical protein [Anaeroselena agilis]|uniref:Uncharacterized protein n=1 Tax=Anaeroselena agilis TaxID=3063788 RepID=A0ABU3NTE7_9FIRM|nr:hypothetical protein [Selenomonadales bacterium 4137-cl]